MAEIQLFFIGISKQKEIRVGGVPTYHWGSYSKWKNFKSPVAKSSKKVKYDKKTKSKKGKSKRVGPGGVTVYGTSIPAHATKMIGGVERTVDVRYYQRGYTIIKRTAALTQDKKMLKTVYTKEKPYQYRLQYKDKVVETDKTYSTYQDGMEYLFFADHYQQDGQRHNTNGHLPHPSNVIFTFFDIRKNFESNANNSESRDNKGTYVLKNVRANVLSIDLTWTGLKAADGREILDTLNPEGGKKYLLVQYRNPVTGNAKNGTFFVSERHVEKYPNGYFKEISVTLTEV